jgi:hypothetical protein
MLYQLSYLATRERARDRERCPGEIAIIPRSQTPLQDEEPQRFEPFSPNSQDPGIQSASAPV